jgi:hypothetical protein
MKWFIVYYVIIAGQQMTFVDTTPFTSWEKCQSEIDATPLDPNKAARAVCAGNNVVMERVYAKYKELTR